MPLFNSIFTVQKERLAAFTDEDAVDCIRELLWAEADTVGITRNWINVPNNIRARDGGIDAEVTGKLSNPGHGIIKNGITRYQIKSGRNFSPGSDTGVKEILFKDNSNKTELKTRVQSCLDKKGTLIIVSFGSDNPDQTDDALVQKYRDALAKIDPKYQNAKIEIWQQSKLQGFFGCYPSLALKISGKTPGNYRTHSSWGEYADIKTPFELGEKQKELISNIKRELIESSAAVHIRIFGEAGVGKTRLVYEALNDESLSPLVVYYESFEVFKSNDLFTDIQHNSSLSVIIVVDDCDEAQSSKIWNQFIHRGRRIKLLTISHEYDKEPATKVWYQVLPLSFEQIKKIIEIYVPNSGYLHEWADLCSGSPRVAHIIGNNLKHNPDNVLKEPDTGRLWDWYISGKDDPQSLEVKTRLRILRYLSLFKKFGFKKPFQEEFKALVSLMNPGVTEQELNEQITLLKKRKILQGDTTLYITPQALHVKLWMEWWETYGEHFNFEEFLQKIPKSLHESFKEMFKYATERVPASKVAQRLLGPEGPFSNAEFLKKKADAKFFLTLSEAEPGLALIRLEMTIGRWSIEKLKNFRAGRREAIFALEKIVAWRSYFHRAASLLLTLAKAENEEYSNNATGIFVKLFSPAYGRFAPSEASPEERFPLLEKILRSEELSERKLAIKAIDNALEIDRFSSPIRDFQVLGRIPKLWEPTTYGEWYDHYRRVWALLNEALDFLPENNKGEVIEIILKRSKALCRHQNIAHMILDSVEDLARRDSIDKRLILATAIVILKYSSDVISDDIKARWIKLQKSLVGTDFHSRMRRYVGMALIEDEDINETGKVINLSKNEIVALATESITNQDSLFQEMSWLVTSEAHNGFLFGYSLGSQDKDHTLLDRLIQKQKEADKNSSVYFLAGYFKALFEMNPDKWENYLTQVSLDNILVKYFAELLWRSGFKREIFLLLIDRVKQGIISGKDLHIFAWGNFTQNFNKDEVNFLELLTALLSTHEFESLSTAIELFVSYYFRGKKRKLPNELTRNILTHPLLTKTTSIENQHTHKLLAHDWDMIASKFKDQYPNRRRELMEFLLNNLGKEDTFLSVNNDEVNRILNLLVKEDPQNAWNLISKGLGPPLTPKSYHLSRLLKEAALHQIPLNLIFDWVDQSIDERAWYLASFIPKTLNKDPSSPARELLIRYGHREDVRRNLQSNYLTSSWSGPESEHYEVKLKKILEYKETETDKNVILWIDEYVDSLKAYIEKAKIREERNGF